MIPAMSIRLTPTSYVVLGLVEHLGTATPYDLKQAATLGVGNFWSLPHTQLYSEPARLAAAGHLEERRERAGRRRRLYTLTDSGRAALDEWRDEPTADTYEIRDAGLLRLYFGADPAALAEVQLEAHIERLRLFESFREADVPEGARLVLEAGIGHEREYARFWSALRDGVTPSSA
jgi:PadR family transcriptional regulator, regulatory protein AphA